MSAPLADVPPFNLDAEENVLGAMMLASAAVDAVSETGLAARDFYRPSNGAIYTAILGLADRGDPTDGIAVAAELVRTGQLEAAGGDERVIELASTFPTVTNAAHYARLVREASTARDIMNVGAALRELGKSRLGSEEEMLARAEEAVYGVTQQRFTTEFIGLQDLFKQEFERILALNEAGHDIVGTPTGFRPLDRLTGGFAGGQLIVLAARPSMGKTALALGMIANLALRLGGDAALFSLEMSRSELMQRLIAMEARVDGKLLRNGAVTSGDWARIMRFGDQVTRLEQQVHIDDNGAVTVPEIRSKLRRVHARRPLSLVVVDYLQLMTGGPNVRLDQRVQEVSRISRGLKVLARELNVPVVALSQLNRDVEQRSDKRPILSDLRESGSIEQDADIVFFVYRDDYYNKDSTDPGMAEIICAKNRNGPTDSVKLMFQKPYARFAEARYDSEEEPR